MAYTRQALPCICVQMENHSVKTAVSWAVLGASVKQIAKQCQA